MATGGVPANTMATGGVPANTCSQPFSQRVLGNMKMLFQEEQLSDVMLAAEGQSIACNKLLLSAASEFFRDRFVTNPDPENPSLLEIDDIDFDTLASVVSCVYSDHIDFTGVSVDKVVKLILAGVQLKIPELTEKCEKYLLGKVESDVQASIDVHRLAKADVLTELREKALGVMGESFQQVVASKAFMELSEDELLQYLQEDNLNVENENPVFAAVVAWVKHDEEARKPSFSRLAESVRLEHCSRPFLKTVVAKEPAARHCWSMSLSVMHRRKEKLDQQKEKTGRKQF